MPGTCTECTIRPFRVGHDGSDPSSCAEAMAAWAPSWIKRVRNKRSIYRSARGESLMSLHPPGTSSGRYSRTQSTSRATRSTTTSTSPSLHASLIYIYLRYDASRSSRATITHQKEVRRDLLTVRRNKMRGPALAKRMTPLCRSFCVWSDRQCRKEARPSCTLVGARLFSSWRA